MSRAYHGKTAEQIETLVEKKLAKGDASPDYAKGGPEPNPMIDPATGQKWKDGRGHSPNSHTTVGKRNRQGDHLKPYLWKAGQSGNPKGDHAVHDMARKIARAVFENNTEQIYNQMARAVLKGNAYAYQVLADRAYGKLKETHDVQVTRYNEASDQTVNERIAELEAKLGIREPPCLTGRISQLEGGTLEASIPPKD
jgi:hypothetical protein